jgi:hypothetical protein
MIYQIDDNIVFPSGHVFHKSFVKSYKGLDIISARRKLKHFYAKQMQNVILHYLKETNIIYVKTENISQPN